MLSAVSLSRTDFVLAEHANSLARHHDGLEDAARVVASSSELAFAAGVVLLLAAGVVLRRRTFVVAGVLALVSAAIALGIGHLISVLIDRPRPFVAHRQIHLFLSHAADASFPSDHVTASSAIGVAIALTLGRRFAWILLVVLALAVSRVLLGLHYPSDVLVGAALGSATAIAICRLARSAGKVDHEGRAWTILQKLDLSADGPRQATGQR